jgi:alkylation response protein AidB-like acyl-CoA dehydrogenase
VDFTFNQTQIDLRDLAKKALEDACDGDALRQVVDSKDGVGESLWSKLVELGWTGLLVDEANGGAGADLLETCIVVEQMGRRPMPGPFFSSCIFAALALRALGEPSGLVNPLLASIGDGSRRGTVGLHELGGSGSPSTHAQDPLSSVKMRAKRKGAGWVVSGIKPLVLDATSATWMLVVARTEEGLRTFLLEDLKSQSTTVEPVPMLDPTRRACRVSFDDTPVTPVGPSGHQGALWKRVLDDVAVCLAAELVGVSDRALEEAISYTTTRIAFDQPIAKFQVVRHRMVDMFQSLEMARVGAQFAAWASDANDSQRERAVAMAASYAAETAVRVTGDNIQVHGGVGFTWRDDAHFLFKRAKQNELLIGGAGFERHRLASMLIAAV